MGTFSWMDCKDTNKAVRISSGEKVFVLIPQEFGGGHIEESYYQGYGFFGSYNVYDLVAEWNKEHMTASLLGEEATADDFGGICEADKRYLLDTGATPEAVEEKDRNAREKAYNDYMKYRSYMVNRLEDFKTLSEDEMMDKYGEDYLYDIGVDIACTDKQNSALPYPIKITHDATAVYEDCAPSFTDDNQGL